MTDISLINLVLFFLVAIAVEVFFNFDSKK